MRLTVKCFATLCNFEPGDQEKEYPDGATVRDIITLLGIPVEDVRIIFINGRGCELDDVLSDGDRLGLFPPVGGG